MRMKQIWLVVLGATLLVSPCPAPACSLCLGDIKQRLTLRQEAEKPEAQLILYGTLANARVSATDLHIVSVVKSHSSLGNKKVVEIPRYLPADPKDPPKYLVFCEV